MYTFNLFTNEKNNENQKKKKFNFYIPWLVSSASINDRLKTFLGVTLHSLAAVNGLKRSADDCYCSERDWPLGGSMATATSSGNMLKVSLLYPDK